MIGKTRVRIARSQDKVRRARRPPVVTDWHPSGRVQRVGPHLAYRHAQVNPHGLRPADLVALQRAVGNGRLQRALEGGQSNLPVTEKPKLQTKKLSAEEKQADLQADDLKNDKRLQDAFDNSPAMAIGEKSEGVKTLQRAFRKLLYALPISFKKTGDADGIFGKETYGVVHQFQVEHGLKQQDGIAGRETLGALDQELLRAQQPQQAPPTPGALAATPASPISPLGPADLKRFRQIVDADDQPEAVRFIARIMQRRGEIDAALLATQLVSKPGQPDCAIADPYVLDPAVNGANTISCGCFTGGSGRSLPNPRIRVNYRIYYNSARKPPPQNIDYEFLAASLHSTLFHEFRHVLQDYAECAAPGTRGGGICTDCNQPVEMDAYLAEIEAGYLPGVYRHAWVRVFVNWDFLAPEQQAVFAARRAAARSKIDKVFPGVDWDKDAEVTLYRGACLDYEKKARADSHGTCDSPMAPLKNTRPGR